MENIFPWYRPYFEFAVQTGLRPSEQVALRWTSIDEATFILNEVLYGKLKRRNSRPKGVTGGLNSGRK
jgi:integrase